MRLLKNKDKVKVTKVRDNQGREAGLQVEHSDGRVDAVARPQTTHWGRNR